MRSPHEQSARTANPLLRSLLVCVVATVATIVALGLAPAAHAGAIVALPGPGVVDHCLDNALPPVAGYPTGNDDGSSGFVPLPFASGFNFAGDTFSGLWVNNNGNVTFNGPHRFAYFPSGAGWSEFVSLGTPMIAPYYMDIDTRAAGEKAVTYGSGMYESHVAFCVDWVDVGYFQFTPSANKLSSFQLLLVDRSDVAPGDFDIIFNYDRVEFETGAYTGGADGLGDPSVQIGYSDGLSATGAPVAPDAYKLSGSGLAGSFLPTAPSLGALTDLPNAGGLLNNSLGLPSVKGRYIFHILGPVPGGIPVSGRVVDGSGLGVANAAVQLCHPLGLPCRTVTTDSTGHYVFAGIATGPWQLTVFPPTATALEAGFLAPVQVNYTMLTLPNVTLLPVGTLPSGTSITTTSHGTVTSGVPTVYGGDPITISTAGCAGGSATAQLIAQDDLASQTITLLESPPITGTTYVGIFDPLATEGPASISVSFTCPGVLTPSTFVFDIYIDPSGTVVDQNGQPVAGATVTLLRSDSATGPFTAVPGGSAVMSPGNRNNPDATNAAGQFGWDVLAGFYEVQASRNGCYAPGNPTQITVTSAVLAIPPSITGLTLTLQCEFAETQTTPGASVPSTLSLSLGNLTPSFGAFAAGVSQTYTTSTTANVTTTAQQTSLTVADPSSVASGHLLNGVFALAQPLQAEATDATHVAAVFAPLGGSASPLTLLAYNTPVSNDAVTIGFDQTINATDPLRTGTYAKTVTFTLSTTTP